MAKRKSKSRKATSRGGSRTRTARRSARRKRSHTPHTAARPRAAPQSVEPVDQDVGDAASSPRAWLPLDAAAGSAALLGLSTILILRGVTTKLNATSTPGLAGAILAGALLAIAVGVRAPHKVAVWISDNVRPMFSARAGRDSEPSVGLTNPTTADVSLYWMVVAVVSLVAGGCAALLPLLMRRVEGVYGLLLTDFLWSPGLDAVPAAAAGFCAAAAALIPIGMLLASLHHLSCPGGQWHTRAGAWYLVGAALGQAGYTYLVGLTGHVELVLAASALPLLIASVVAVLVSRPARRAKSARADESGTSAPLLRDRRPTLTRLCIVATAVCGLIVAGAGLHRGGTGFDSVVDPLAAGEPHAASVRLAAAMLAAAIGALLGSRAKNMGLGGFRVGGWTWGIHSPRQIRNLHSAIRNSMGYPTISGFGLACAIAGALAALGSFFNRFGSADASILGATAIAAGVGAIAFAAAYGIESLLLRVGSRSAVGGTLLFRMIVVFALWCALAQRLLEVGAAAALLPTLVALLLVGMGASLIIREPSHLPQTRRIRLAAVAAATLVLILTWPPAVGTRSANASEEQLPSGSERVNVKVAGSAGGYP